MSNRAIASHYGVSYQTAHRLVGRLVEQGLLQRRDRSGTYVPGPAWRPTHVQLIFHSRARIPGSFGAKLLEVVHEALTAAGLGEATVCDEGDNPQLHALPVLWECHQALERCLADGRRAILLNDRPTPGLDAKRIDSVATDDFVGGVLAGQYLRRLLGPSARCAVLAGPKRDRRSRARVAGFATEHDARVVRARTWYEPDAEAVAPRVLQSRPDAVFCCNDRLAQGLLHVVRERGADPPVVAGFDDAPIAGAMGLTTVAIPWASLAAGVARIAADRLGGDGGPSTHLVYYPELIARREQPLTPGENP